MTVDLRKIDALIKAVEEGNLHKQPYGGMPIATACYPRDEKGRMMPDKGGWSDGDCLSAYHGSLDAAKALHEALLPGWQWTLTCEGGAEVWPTAPSSQTKAVIHTCPNNPAHAWLVAMLRAHRVNLEAAHDH